MPLTTIPTYTSLVDGQFLQIQGPDGITTGYHYDAQQRALYFKESQVLFPSLHGPSHIAEDPVPDATTDTPGLMSADDKAKLDSLLGMRVGVLGFQGAGFPDDGGWMQGDIILAAGTEFISLERIGNVVRFTVDSPLPLNCACEECQQIFWVQDETDIASIRPPTCSGKLPGVNAYGELKIYLFPESTIADPNNTSVTLQNKGNYPALIFKRYDDSITPGYAEHELILKRDDVNSLQTEIGWAFTPGAAGVPEMVWFMGKNDDGGQIRFDLETETTPGLLGAVLFNGNLITKKMGVIIAYTSTILSTNQYTVRLWDVDEADAVGDSITAKNVWQYMNPENPTSGSNPQQLLLDGSIDLLPLGTLVDLWSFQVGEVAGEPILRWYFSKRPASNPLHTWGLVGLQQFGDVSTARAEIQPGPGSDDMLAAEDVSAIRTLERNLWGLTGYEDPVLWYDIVTTAGTEAADVSQEHRAAIDASLPGLRVYGSPDVTGDFSERPVWFWNRKNMTNALLRADIGRPSGDFAIYDIALRADIDEHTDRYMTVLGIGTVSGLNYVRVCGVHFHDLPPFGTIRILSPESNRNLLFNYARKFMFPSAVSGEGGGPGVAVDACNSVVLACSSDSNVAYSGAVGDIVELLHQEYSSHIVRIELSLDQSTQLVSAQFKVGTLSMSEPYENDIAADDVDDYVRGMEAGYTVSAVYSQSGVFTGVGTQPDASPDGFVVYEGGAQIGGDLDEYWNKLEIMLRDDQVWVWWNELLIPPSTTLSAGLPTPVTVTTPYFPIDTDVNKRYGKCGMRLWPGAMLRRFELRTQSTQFSEFSYGQLEVV